MWRESFVINEKLTGCRGPARVWEEPLPES
jgi:hypothetical protein